jgi:hypothetical protein
MIIAFAFGLIGALLVLANCRHLRARNIFIAAFIMSSVLAAFGVYLIIDTSKETVAIMLFPMFTPLTALILLFFTRIVYRRRTKTEIILHMHGLFPVRQMERYVTRQENYITFILLVSSVVIPYLALKMIL